MMLCRYLPVSKGLSNGAQAGITIAVLIGLAVLIAVPVVLLKRRKAQRRALREQESRARLVQPSQSSDPEIGP
jgi:hypothetical protein